MGGTRVRRAIFWLAIVNFASLGGPFVPAMYGAVGTIWLLTILAAAAETHGEAWTWIALLAAITLATLVIGTPRPREIPASSTLILSVVTQAGIFAANLFAAGSCARVLRPARIPGVSPVPAV